MHFAVWSQISLLHHAAGIKSTIFTEISLLRYAVNSQISLLHNVTGRFYYLLHNVAVCQILPLHYDCGVGVRVG
jgi:hypothetical protein